MESINNDIKIFKKGNPKNQSIIFVHGFPFDHFMWDKQINFLSADYYCVTYDVRGLGKSKFGDGQFTMEMFVDDLELVMDELNLTKTIICGLSMGGYISLRAVEKFENKLGGLILIDTKSEADTNQAKLNRASGIKRINIEGSNVFVEDFMQNCFSKEFINKQSEEYKRIVEHSYKFNSIGIKGCLLAMAGRTDTTDYLNKIKIPIVVLCGEKDQLTPPEVMKNMSAKIKNSKYFIVPGAGHISPVENSRFVNEKIKEFLVSHLFG